MPNKKKNNSFISKLSLNTKKGKFFAFIIIFALIGGMYLTYRTFALTHAITIQAASDYKVARNYSFYRDDYAKIRLETRTSKRAFEVLEVYGANPSRKTGGWSFISPPTSYDRGRYQACFNFENARNQTIFFGAKRGVTYLDQQAKYVQSNRGVYVTECVEFNVSTNDRGPDSLQFIPDEPALLRKVTVVRL